MPHQWREGWPLTAQEALEIRKQTETDRDRQRQTERERAREELRSRSRSGTGYIFEGFLVTAADSFSPRI